MGQVVLSIGTSGWQYRDWRERFYPKGLPQRLWLEHYAGHYSVVEVNSHNFTLLALLSFLSFACLFASGRAPRLGSGACFAKRCAMQVDARHNSRLLRERAGVQRLIRSGPSRPRSSNRGSRAG